MRAVQREREERGDGVAFGVVEVHGRRHGGGRLLLSQRGG
jgi:hypothetical protein